MHLLNAKLAQDIVERTMQIIPYNVNVMDDHGTILASGDPTRVGELHSGALLALAQKDVVEIDTVSAKTMHGAKPGVNLPLSINGELCGAVGLSGPPEEVSQFGKLVKLTAEMILEQANLVHELQRNSQYKEAFLLNLIHFEHSSDADLYAWGQRLGYDLERTQLIFILELKNTSPELLFREMQKLQTRLSSHQSSLLSATLAPDEMVILDSYDAPKNKKNAELLPQQHLDSLRKWFQNECDLAFTLSMGIALTGLTGVRTSYMSAKTTSKIGRARHADDLTHSYYELALPVLLSGLGTQWQAEQLSLPLTRLREGDKKDKMLETTVKTWFACNENLFETAHTLGIHRNSLDYRLRRIEDITGFDLKKTEDRFLLYVSALFVSE